jgi:hypothetical protein
LCAVLLFFDRRKGIVEVSSYNKNGRLEHERRFEGIKTVEFKDVGVRSSQGIEHGITLYVIEDSVSIEARGAKLTVKKMGEKQ